MCNGLVVPKTCGFWKCEYQFEGDKIEDGKLKVLILNVKKLKKLILNILVLMIMEMLFGLI